jgi:hypothetical protein
MKARILIVSIIILITMVAAESPSLQGVIGIAKPFGQSEESDSEPLPIQGVIGIAKPFGQSEESDSEPLPIQGVIGIAKPFGQPETTETAQPEVVSELPSSTIIYIGGTTIPLSSYQTDLGKYLWIEGDRGLYQYASINQYATISLVAYTSTAGPGEFLELYPSNSNQGAYLKTYYKFGPGYNRIPYRADVAGTHYLIFTMNNQPSNAIILDVKGTDASTILGTAPSNLNDQGISIDPIDQLNPQPEPPMPELN